MTSAFISYSGEDRAIARQITIHLRTLGLRVWIDEAKVKIGRRFKDEIRDTIDSSDYFILIMSNSSLKSSWVLFELKTALGKEAEVGKLFIVPCLVDDVDLPDELADRHFIDFRDVERHSEKLCLLAEHVGHYGDVSAQDPLTTPKGINIARIGDNLILTRRWLSSQLFMPQFRMFATAFLFTSIFHFFLPETAFHLEDPLDFVALLFLAVLYLLLIVQLYAILVTVINKQIVELSPSRLSVRHGPLPSVVNRSCSVPAAEITCIKGVEERLHLSTNVIVTYSLCVIREDGREVIIPTGTPIYKSEQITFLIELICTYLGVSSQWSIDNSPDDAEAALETKTDYLRNLAMVAGGKQLLKEPRASVLLGNDTLLARRFYAHRFILGMFLGAVGVSCAVLSGWSGIESSAVWRLLSMIAIITSILLAVNNRRLLIDGILPIGIIGAGGVLITGLKYGMGYNLILVIASLACMRVCAALGRLPRELSRPVRIAVVSKKKLVKKCRGRGLAVDVVISRPTKSADREIYHFTDSKEVLYKLIEWRNIGEGADIALTWDKTDKETSKIVRHRIREQTGLYFLTQSEREKIWKWPNTAPEGAISDR